MLEFSDLPYEFVPAKPNGFVILLAQWANRRFALPGKNHRVAGIAVQGAEAFAEAHGQSGARFVLLPNHPTHSDPQLMTEICRQLRVRPAFMAAYDVFARSKLNSWVMQRTGAFSVDREGSDRKSMKCAAQVLSRGKHPLVIFPEGNVYLCNDRVTPFAEGAAYIALRAQRELAGSAPVYAVPVSIKYSFVEDVRERLRDSLGQIGGEFDRGAEIVTEIRRLGTAALADHLNRHGHIPPEDASAPADEQIAHAAEQIITSLESNMGLCPRAGDQPMARVRKIRAAIHAVRVDPERETEHEQAASWADQAMLALRVLGYAGGYAAGNPTLDRVAETVARLREDVTNNPHPPDGRRRALVRIGQPIDLRERLDKFTAKARPAIRELTADCEDAVQSGINAINANNDLPGSEPF